MPKLKEKKKKKKKLIAINAKTFWYFSKFKCKINSISVKFT